MKTELICSIEETQKNGKCRRSFSTDYNISLVLVFFTFLIVHLVLMFYGNDIPLIYNDEAGYLAYPRYILFKQGTLHDYYPGYGLILLPIFSISNNIEIAYKLVQILNSFLMSSVPLLAYFLISALDDKGSNKTKLFIAVIVSLYPPYLLYSNLAWSEVLFVPLYLLLVLQVTYLSQGKCSKKIWISTFVSYIYLILTHPRAFAILPVVFIVLIWCLLRTMNIDIIKILNENRRKSIIIVSLFATFIVLIISTVIFILIKSDRYGASEVIMRLLNVEEILASILTFVSQLYYLALSTYGFVVLGMIGAAHYLYRNIKMKQKSQQYITVFFILFSFILTMLLSALFMNQNIRADHIIYGRYNEGVMLPVLILGILYYKDKFLNNKWIKLVFVMSMLLLILVTGFAFANDLEIKVMNTVNVFGLYLYNIILKDFHFITVTISMILIILIIYIIGIKYKRYSIIAVGIMFLACTVFADIDYFSKSNEGRKEQFELIHIFKKFIAINSNNELKVYFEGIDEHTTWHKTNYQIFVPEIKPVKLQQGQPLIPSEVDMIVSDKIDLNKQDVRFKDARLVGLENHYNLYLWVLPNEATNFLINEGYVLPKDFPSLLPDEAYKSVINVDVSYNDEYNSDESSVVPVFIKHVGKKAFWPNLYGIKDINYSVRLGLKLYHKDNLVNQVRGFKINLPESLYPGEETKIEMPLDILNNLRDGEYILRLELVQDYATWFSEKGDDALNLLVNVYDGKFKIIGKSNKVDLPKNNFKFKSITPSELIAFNKRYKGPTFFKSNLKNFIGQFIENGEGIIKNINLVVEPSDKYIVIETNGIHPMSNNLENLNLKLYVNNQEVEFSHYNSNRYFFNIPSDIREISEVKIISSVFSPSDNTDYPKFLYNNIDDNLKIKQSIAKVFARKNINLDSNKYGIDIKSIKIAEEKETIGKEINYDLLGDSFTNFYSDRLWTNGHGIINDISYDVKTEDTHIAIVTKGLNPFKDDMDKLKLNILINGATLKFEYKLENTYFYKLDKNIKEINRIDILSSTFMPKQMGITDDMRNLGIDIDYIKICDGLYNLNKDIIVKDIPKGLHNLYEDMWTNGHGVINNIRFKVKPNARYLCINTKGSNPFKEDIEKLKLKMIVNDKLLEFAFKQDNYYYFVLPKDIKEINKIEILSSVFIPKEMKINDDIRELGIDLVLISIQ